MPRPLGGVVYRLRASHGCCDVVGGFLVEVSCLADEGDDAPPHVGVGHLARLLRGSANAPYKAPHVPHKVVLGGIAGRRLIELRGREAAIAGGSLGKED